MKENHAFSQRELFDKIQEVEQLAAAILTMEPNEQQRDFMYRYAVVKDQIQDLLMVAEEVLSAQALTRLRARVNTIEKPKRWDFYRNRNGTREIKRITGKNLWEHARLDLSLGDLFNSSPNDLSPEP